MQLRDVSDQIHEPRRTYWAWFSIVVVLIVFGIFWYTEQAKNTQEPIPAPTQTSTTRSLDTLQAAVIESDIPDFSKEF